MNALQADSDWRITVHVHNKAIQVTCGEGSQRIKWAAQVAIAQWDDKDMQGWKYLGIPLEIKTQSGMELDPSCIIRDALTNGEHLVVTTSLDPAETV